MTLNFSNKNYDLLKWIALIVLPGIGALYLAMSKIWGFPYGDEVLPTIMAIDVVLGIVLEFAKYQYTQSQNAEYLSVLKLYDVTKWASQIALPAIGAMYIALANIWGLPYGEQVVAMVVSVDIFLGIIVDYLNNQYVQNKLELKNLMLTEEIPNVSRLTIKKK